MKYFIADWIIEADKIRNGSFHSVLTKSVELGFDLKYQGIRTADNFNAIRFVLSIPSDVILQEFAEFSLTELGIANWSETSKENYNEFFPESVRVQRQNPNYSTNLRLIDGLISDGLANERHK